MNNEIFELFSKLEENRVSDVLFNVKSNYNFVLYQNENIKKVFVMVCKNFLKDNFEKDTGFVNTVRYWFLHNMMYIMKEDLNNLDNYGENELKILKDYLEVIYKNGGSECTKFIYLPEMAMFNGWIGLSNIEKKEIHKKILLEIMYLDDNYFFIINYFSRHNRKFIENTFKKEIDIKGNNLLMHLIRSAIYKNTELSLKNFKKVWFFVKNNVYKMNLMDILLKKNNKGQMPIHYLCNLQNNYYNFLISEIVGIKFEYLMEKVIWHILRNIRNYNQLEILMEEIVGINNNKSFEEKFAKYKHIFKKTYKNLLGKNILFDDKLSIISNLRDYGLIEIEKEDKKILGKRLWEELEKENIG